MCPPSIIHSAVMAKQVQAYPYTALDKETRSFHLFHVGPSSHNDVQRRYDIASAAEDGRQQKSIRADSSVDAREKLWTSPFVHTPYLIRR